MLVLRTHPVGSVVSNVERRFVHLPVFVLAPLHEAVDDDAQAPISHGYRCQGPTCFSSQFPKTNYSSGFVTMRRMYGYGGRHLVLSGASMGRGCHESVMGIVMNGTLLYIRTIGAGLSVERCCGSSS